MQPSPTLTNPTLNERIEMKTNSVYRRVEYYERQTKSPADFCSIEEQIQQRVDAHSYKQMMRELFKKVIWRGLDWDSSVMKTNWIRIRFSLNRKEPTIFSLSPSHKHNQIGINMLSVLTHIRNLLDVIILSYWNMYIQHYEPFMPLVR